MFQNDFAVEHLVAAGPVEVDGGLLDVGAFAAGLVELRAGLVEEVEIIVIGSAYSNARNDELPARFKVCIHSGFPSRPIYKVASSDFKISIGPRAQWIFNFDDSWFQSIL